MMTFVIMTNEFKSDRATVVKAILQVIATELCFESQTEALEQEEGR